MPSANMMFYVSIRKGIRTHHWNYFVCLCDFSIVGILCVTCLCSYVYIVHVVYTKVGGGGSTTPFSPIHGLLYTVSNPLLQRS